MSIGNGGGCPVYPLERDDPLQPPPDLARLRRRGSVSALRYADGSAGWLVLSYALVRQVLSDPRFASSAPGAKWNPLVGPWTWEPGGNLIVLDGPEHTHLRRLHASYFTVRRIKEMRPQLDALVSERIDSVERGPLPVDLVQQFARPVHSDLVRVLLGLSVADMEWLERLRPSALRDSGPASSKGERATREYRTALRKVIAGKRSKPGDDVLSAMAKGGELSDDEIVIAATNLSGTTAANMIALAVFALLAQHASWDALAIDRSRTMETAVDELLRFVGAFQAVFRIALEDVELDGVSVRKGDWLALSLVGANHDPERFSSPEKLDFARDASEHLAFGFGRHLCLGHRLARVELEAALWGLVRRFPTMHLAVPVDQVELYDASTYGVKALPVAW